jgi:hypothetical protein
MERRRIAFQFRLGAHVHRGHGGTTYTVMQQRFTARPGGLPPVIEYLLRLPKSRSCIWAYEPDLTPAEETVS